VESLSKEEAAAKYPEHECLIYFIDRPQKNWWDYVFRTREGFRHCFLIQWDEWAQRYLLIDWRQYQTDICILFDFEVEKRLKSAHMRGVKPTVVRFWAKKHLLTEAFPIKYCSNTLLRFLGLGNRVLLTPYGLYRTLLGAGGEVVYSWREDNEWRRRPDENPESSGTTTASA
jgi:hypothetical protein